MGLPFVLYLCFFQLAVLNAVPRVRLDAVFSYSTHDKIETVLRFVRDGKHSAGTTLSLPI
jgi:hypothetical protein